MAKVNTDSLSCGKVLRFPLPTCPLTPEERTYVVSRSSMYSILYGKGIIEDFPPRNLLLMAVPGSNGHWEKVL